MAIDGRWILNNEKINNMKHNKYNAIYTNDELFLV